MTKAWWLGFPVFRCPHCGRKIQGSPGKGIKFVGHFVLPKGNRTGRSLEEPTPVKVLVGGEEVTGTPSPSRKPRGRKREEGRDP